MHSSFSVFLLQERQTFLPTALFVCTIRIVCCRSLLLPPQMLPNTVRSIVTGS